MPWTINRTAFAKAPKWVNANWAQYVVIERPNQHCFHDLVLLAVLLLFLLGTWHGNSSPNPPSGPAPGRMGYQGSRRAAQRGRGGTYGYNAGRGRFPQLWGFTQAAPFQFMDLSSKHTFTHLSCWFNRFGGGGEGAKRRISFLPYVMTSVGWRRLSSTSITNWVTRISHERFEVELPNFTGTFIPTWSTATLDMISPATSAGSTASPPAAINCSLMIWSVCCRKHNKTSK